MSDNFWKVLLLIVVIGRIIELSYKFYKWKKEKKIRTPKNKSSY